MRHEVCGLEELEPGTLTSVEVDGVAIVIARTPNGGVHALRDRCSHEGAKLSNGLLLETILSDVVDQYALADDAFVIRCPWHGYEFDLESGRCLADPQKARVRAYDVVVEDDRVYVERH